MAIIKEPSSRTGRPLCFKSGREWRAWLEKNHATATEAWLLHYKKNSGKTSIGYGEALEEALCFGWIDGKEKGIDAESYAIRFSPRRARIKCTLWLSTLCTTIS